MRLAVMQPYLFPYLGYFQLMAAVDRFVVLDDVNYINRGWINRNRILVGGKPHTFTMPLDGASQNRLIRDIDIAADYENWAARFLKTLRHAYSGAANFAKAVSTVESILAFPGRNLSDYLTNSLQLICDFMDIRTEIIPTSSVYDKGGLAGADRIMDICAKDGADTYVNPPGGRELYDEDAFAARGVKLEFLEPVLTEYPQCVDTFIPGLSVLDAMMTADAALLAQGGRA